MRQHTGIAILIAQVQAGILWIDVVCLVPNFAEIVGNKACRVVLAGRFHAVHEFFLGIITHHHTGAQVVLDVPGNLGIELQIACDFGKPFHNRGEHRLVFLVGQVPGCTVNEHVRDLGVLVEPFAGSGNHHDATLGIGRDDIADLADLLGIGHGRATKLAYLHRITLQMSCTAEPCDGIGLRNIIQDSCPLRQRRKNLQGLCIPAGSIKNVLV